MRKVVITGYDEVLRTLRTLPDVVQHNKVNAAWEKASRPLQSAARRNLMSDTKPKTGNLYKSIGAVKMPFKSKALTGEVWVGPRRKYGFKGHHGHLIEFGHKKVLWGKRTNERVKGYPFMRPAWESTKGVILNQFKEELGVKMVSHMKKMLGKYGHSAASVRSIMYG